MNGIGKVDGGSLARQDDHLAFGGEGVNLFGIEIDLEGGEELARIAHFVLPLKDVAQPGEALLVAGPLRLPFLVLPVGRNAHLRHAVHLLGAQLHLEGLAVRTNHRGMQRLVEIRTRDGNEIFDPARHGPPGIVDDAQGSIAVLDGVRDNAEGQQVVDLVGGNVLALEFLPDAVEALDAAFEARGDRVGLHLGLHGRLDFGQEFLADLAPALHRLLDFHVGFRFQVPEGEVFQFAADLPHPQAVGNGRVDVERFPGDALDLVSRQILKGPHVVKAVRQFHQDHADVIDDGQNHLAEVLGLLFLRTGKVNPANLGHALHDAGDLRPEVLLQLVDRNRRVFHDVVEHPRRQTNNIQPHVRQEVDHFQEVGKVRLSRKTLLRLMLRGGKFVRAPQQPQILTGTIRLNLRDDVFEAQHAFS